MAPDALHHYLALVRVTTVRQPAGSRRLDDAVAYQDRIELDDDTGAEVGRTTYRYAGVAIRVARTLAIAIMLRVPPGRPPWQPILRLHRWRNRLDRRPPAAVYPWPHVHGQGSAADPWHIGDPPQPYPDEGPRSFGWATGDLPNPTWDDREAPDG